MNKTFLLTSVFIFLFTACLFAQPPYKAGEAVDILWSGSWYKGKIVEFKNNKYLISYDGYSSSWNEWVEAARLRRPGGSQAQPAVSTTPEPTSTNSNRSNGSYKAGDRVEIMYAGDWYRATITRGPEGSGAQAMYEAKMDGYTYTEKYKADRLRPLYRPNEKQSFTVGNKVLFRRWDGKEYEAEVVGVDGAKYHLSYMRDGYKNTEWVPEIGVKESPNNKNTAALTFPGQKYKIGDRVMYDNGSFLTGPYYGTVVSVDVEKRMYTIKDEKDASSRYSYPCYGVLAPGEKPDNSFFIGKWEMYVSGATFTYTKDNERYRRVSGGMKLQPLEIKADGTYVWNTDKKVIKGNWKPRSGVPGITLLKGLDGLDWTVYQNTEALAAQKTTRDEIRFHHIPTSTGYYMAYRIGANKSCVLAGRTFK